MAPSGRGPWAERATAEGGVASPLAVTVLVPEAGDVHENDAAVRLAAALVGSGVSLRGPVESRVDVLAAHDGVLRVDVTGVIRIDRIDPVSVFTAYDGQVVSAGAIVASVKVGPHLVPESVLEHAEAVLRRRPGPLVSVLPFQKRRVAALVRETLGPAARERFEASVRTRVERLGSKLIEISYVPDDATEVTTRLHRLTSGSPAVDILLTAGAGSTDPARSGVRGARRAGRPRGQPRRARAPGLHALARPAAPHHDHRPADLRRLLQGHGR